MCQIQYNSICMYLLPISHSLRLAETGEGHFFFTGRHAYRLFESMKTELMARAQQKTHSQNRSLPSSLESVAHRTNLSRSVSSASSMSTGKQNHPLAANTHATTNGQPSPLAGQKPPLGPRLSHSNGVFPVKSSASLEESETSSEDYSPSDNSSSFTGTGGSLQDWTTPSPISFAGNGLFERPPMVPPRISDGRPFSPCSTTSSSSSSTSGYNVPRRSYLLPPPTSSSVPHYMKVKHDLMDADGDYMTMNPALRKKTPPTTRKEMENGKDEEKQEKKEEEEEENDDEYVDDEYVDGYTDMQSAKTNIPTDFADQYMRMVPIGGSEMGTLTRNSSDVTRTGRASSLPPSPPPQMASRFREMKIIESSSNTFPGASQEGTKS